MRYFYFFLIIAAFGCKETSVRLAGSYSTRESAFELAPDKKIVATFAADRKIFYFKIRGQENRMLRAELSPVRGIDTAMRLMIGDKTIAVNDNGSSLGEEISAVFIPPGETWLVVEAVNAFELSQDFNLFYRVFNAPPNVEIEPNDTLATATSVTGNRATGFYDSSQDCFLFSPPIEEKSLLQFNLTAVDGVISQLEIFDLEKNILLSEKTSGAMTPVAQPISGKLYACVRAVKRDVGLGRDYYELSFDAKPIENKTEIEPNDTPEKASHIGVGRIMAVLSSLSDVDVFSFRNSHDYAVHLRAELTSVEITQLQFIAAKRNYSQSAQKSAIAENLRAEAGEDIQFAIQVKGKPLKKIGRIEYILEISEIEAIDENENEPNDMPEKADALPDLTQKWAFINPPGDIDYFRISSESPTAKSLKVESKIDCRIKIEHLRAGKSIATKTGKPPFAFKGDFLKDDLVRLSCQGQKPNPAERGYRLILGE